MGWSIASSNCYFVVLKEKEMFRMDKFSPVNIKLSHTICIQTCDILGNWRLGWYFTSRTKASCNCSSSGWIASGTGKPDVSIPAMCDWQLTTAIIKGKNNMKCA